MTALILSGSYLESNRYLQSEGIRGRHATDSASLQGAYFTRIIQLPSFLDRPDRHAILATIKRNIRSKGKVDWTVLEEWTPPAPPAPGEEGYKADMLFGDVPESLPYDIGGGIPSGLTVIELAEALGHDLPPNEDTTLMSSNDHIPESDSTVTPEPKPAKKAAAKPRTKTSAIDDLFGDD